MIILTYTHYTQVILQGMQIRMKQTNVIANKFNMNVVICKENEGFGCEHLQVQHWHRLEGC